MLARAPIGTGDGDGGPGRGESGLDLPRRPETDAAGRTTSSRGMSLSRAWTSPETGSWTAAVGGPATRSAGQTTSTAWSRGAGSGVGGLGSNRPLRALAGRGAERPDARSERCQPAVDPTVAPEVELTRSPSAARAASSLSTPKAAVTFGHPSPPADELDVHAGIAEPLGRVGNGARLVIELDLHDRTSRKAMPASLARSASRPHRSRRRPRHLGHRSRGR